MASSVGRKIIITGVNMVPRPKPEKKVRMATLAAPAEGQTWKNGNFAIGADTSAEPAGTAIAPPDMGSDVQDPPVRIEFNVTSAFQAALSAGEFHGFFVAGMPDRKIDDGYNVRVQLRTVDNGDGSNSPELVIVHER